MKIALPPHLDHFVQEKVKSGRFDSPEEVVRHALRLWEDLEQTGPDEDPVLESLMLAGLSGPKSRMLSRDWEQIRREGRALAERHRKHNAA